MSCAPRLGESGAGAGLEVKVNEGRRGEVGVAHVTRRGRPWTGRKARHDGFTGPSQF